MTLPTVDARPGGFQVRWPAAGDVTILLRAPEDALADTELDVWVQPKALPVPEFDTAERTLTATVGTVEQVTVDGTTVDQATVTFTGVDELEQGTWFRLFVADGEVVWCNGLVMGDNSGTETQTSTLDVTLSTLTLDLTLTVLSGTSTGGPPTGGAGGALSGSYPNPGLNTEVVQDLVGAMAGAGLVYDDESGELSVTDTGAGTLTVALQHLTNLDVAAPHPFGAFLPAGVLIELSGQTDASENGTYVAPANAASNPLISADDQILDFANLGREVVALRVITGPYTYGPFEWIVSVDTSNTFRFSPQSGTTLFAQAVLDLNDDPLGVVDFDGALNAGALVLVVEANGATDNGLWRFVADGEEMERSLIEAGAGTTVRVMLSGQEWVNTPHSGWVRVDPGARLTDVRAAVAAMADELAPSITRVFRCDGTSDTSWTALGTLTSDLTSGIAVRCLRIPTRPTTVPWFAEFFTQTHDGAGAWDNMENADLLPDGSFGGITATSRPHLFWEQAESGGTEDGSGWWPDVGMEYGRAVETLTSIDFATGTGRMWVRVPSDLGDGGIYHVAADGAIFRLMDSRVSAKFESVDDFTDEPWIMGYTYFGDIVALEVADGLDGTVIANPDARDVTPGATSFTDAAGVTWTAEVDAEVVALDSTTIDAAAITSGTINIARIPTGTTSTTVALGNDARFSDARTPTAHTHAAGDVNSGTFDAARIPNLDAAKITTGTLDAGRIPASMQPHTYTKALPSSDVSYSNLGFFNTVAALNNLTAVNRRLWVPIYVRADTFTRIGVNVTSGAASTWRLGLHADDGGWPASAVLADYGTIDLSGAAGRRDITISQTLTSGWWWVQIQVDAYTAVPTCTGIGGQSAHPVVPLGFPTSRISGRSLAGFTDTGGTGGALGTAPASLAASGITLVNDTPRVWIWKA